MTNKEIANTFAKLGKIMALHDENPFKSKSYANAYLTIRNLAEPLAEMEAEEISQLRGVGKAISDKINELLGTGELQTLNKYLDMTPPGVVEMMAIKGFGPKKIKVIWKELGVESPGELLYACHENRLVELKGFGTKTQDSLIKQINYFLDSKGKFLYASVADIAQELVDVLSEELPEYRFEVTGEVRRKLPIINSIEIITDFDDNMEEEMIAFGLEELTIEDEELYYRSYPFSFIQVAPEEFYEELVCSSSSEEFRTAIQKELKEDGDSERSIFESNKLQYVEPELREDAQTVKLSKQNKIPVLIKESDIKGVIHTHTNYSDGQNTLTQMAAATKEKGYEYILITDHSKAAFYANGLQVERVHQQLDEIDMLNKKMSDFRIFKGIESDILNNGDLDYEEDILQQFDVIIASVHSNLKMDEEKANKRLIKAIENPYTRILGHPTGRLLLSREGYPIDHQKIIDACAANGVAIELNANPNRLDMDYTWIPYAVDKGVLISINPDAHSISGIDDIRWGVAAARKGGLLAEQCLNTMNREVFTSWISD